jgi:hypothetical protein
MADAIPTMTSNTAPSGTASASTQLSATYYAYKALDDDTATWWSTTSAGVVPCWLMYDWGPYNTKIVTSYTITARGGGGNQKGAPKTFKLQGYNGSTYTDLSTPSDQTSWGDGEQRTFNFTNTTAYRGYRLYITANNTGTYTEIAEFELILSATPLPRVELGGVQVVATAPAARIEVAGVQVVATAPACRIELAGVQVIWDESGGGLLVHPGMTGNMRPEMLGGFHA